MEVTDPSVSVELWRSSTQGETLPRSKICASFPFEHLQRWTEKSIIIINCLKGSPWFASFSPQIVLPSVTWWEGTDDTGSGGSAKKDLILFYGDRLIEGGLNPFFWRVQILRVHGEERGTDDKWTGGSANKDFACNVWFWQFGEGLSGCREKELFELAGYD